MGKKVPLTFLTSAAPNSIFELFVRYRVFLLAYISPFCLELSSIFAYVFLMPRPSTILSMEYPYHVRVRSNNRDWFELPMVICFNACAQVMEKTISKYQIEVHAFVLMSNHFHMILSTPKGNLGAALRYFLTELSRQIRLSSLRINHVFGGRNKSTLITSTEYYANCFKYIARNPVRAGITDRVELYRWSTFAKEEGAMHRLISSVSTGHALYIPENLQERLAWLNEPFEKEIEYAVKRGLRKNRLIFSPDPKTRKMPNPFKGLKSPDRTSEWPQRISEK